MQPPRAVKDVLGLTKLVGQAIDEVRMELRARLPHWTRRTDFNRAYRELPTNAAARACVEVAPDATGVDGDFGSQPDCHPIARVSGTIPCGFGAHRQNLANVVDNPFGEEKPGREVQIGAG